MTPADLGRSLRLSIGTLTALRVPAVREVTPASAAGAMLVAPLAVLPLAVLVTATLLLGDRIGVPPMATGFVAVGLLALGSRALHLDGLSDVADGLTASYDPDRSLAVMKGGTAGPAGVVAVVVVLGAQASALAVLAGVGTTYAALLAGGCVCASRAALWLVCARPVPPARPDGLGVTFTQRVPAVIASGGWIALAGLATLLSPVAGPVTVAVAAGLVLLVIWRAVRRFGGVTGDVFGTAIEITLAVLLVGAATFALPA